MPRFVLHHRHPAAQCGIAFAAWRGYDSPLRHTPALASCAAGGHAVWFVVNARDRSAALAQLPGWLAERTDVDEITEVDIP